jgi:hypothetical protein
VQRYVNFIASTTSTSSTLMVLSNATCTVYVAGTSTAATLYSDNGITPLANPFLSSSTGQVAFYAANGLYDLVVSKIGYLTVTISAIELDDLLAPSGSNSVGYLPAGTGAVATTVQTKLRESVSVKDFGAVGDGVTNDTTAVTAASAYPKTYVPAGTYDTTFVNYTTVPGSWWGVGQIADASNRKLAPWYANANAAPASTGNRDSLLTAFNGDLSRCQFAVGHNISGAATLTQPTTGYVYTPEVYPHYTYLNNTSGWNQSTSGNDGRTQACAYFTRIDNYGQGDCVAYNASAFVSGTRSGSTNFLANPAAGLFSGQVSAGSDGVYLNPYETILSDNGYDVAAVGIVNNFVRTNATGAKSVFWHGYRAQNQGTATCDAVISATGLWVTGLDLAMSDFGANKGAVSLKANDRVYFNSTAGASGSLNAGIRTTVFGTSWMAFDSVSGEMQLANGSATQFAVSSTASAVNYFQALGGAAGGSPQFRATGSDTNISVGYLTKGTGFHFFYSNVAAPAVQFAINGNQTSAVNYLTVRGAVAGTSPQMTATGSDTNIDLSLITKGTGVVQYGTYTAGVVAQAGYITIKDAGGTTRRLLVG